MLKELLQVELTELTVDFTPEENQLAEEMAGGCGCFFKGSCGGADACVKQ